MNLRQKIVGRPTFGEKRLHISYKKKEIDDINHNMQC